MPFFSRHSRISFDLSWSSCLAIRDLCFVLVSGHSCQPKRLHRSALDIDLAFASFLESFSARIFTPSVVFTPVVCASGEELYLVSSLASPFPVWLINPPPVVIVVPVPSDLFISKVFPLVFGSPKRHGRPLGQVCSIFRKVF